MFRYPAAAAAMAHADQTGSFRVTESFLLVSAAAVFRVLSRRHRLTLNLHFPGICGACSQHTVRIIDEWNSLAAALLRCNDVETLKRKLDCQLKIGDTNKLELLSPCQSLSLTFWW